MKRSRRPLATSPSPRLGLSLLAAPLLAAPLLACSIGDGTGYVRSARLRARSCWDGPFDLRPNFFAANPYEDTLSIRIQRSQENIGTSDGVSLLVDNVSVIREERLGEQLSLGLPVGVQPLGTPLRDPDNPPEVNLSLYLNNSCRNENVLLYAIDGWVSFDQLFSGELNEGNAEDRITEGRFEATVADIAPPSAAREQEASIESQLSGHFRFVFHRGTPAQPFP